MRHARDELRDNPAWVNRAIAKNWNRILDAVEPEMHPLMEDAHARGKGLVIEIPEHGCGAYGCVMPTNSADVAFKVTTDSTEADFVEKVLPTVQPTPEGIVRYYEALRLEGHHARRGLFALWREEAQDVGELHEVHRNDPDGVKRTRDLIFEQREAAGWVFTTLGQLGERAAEVYRQAIELRADALGDVVEDGYASTSGSVAHEVAAHLAYMEVCCQTLVQDSLAPLVGSALLTFLQHGVLVADIHEGNIGRCERDGELAWVITDPGHVAVLGAPWGGDDEAPSLPARDRHAARTVPSGGRRRSGSTRSMRSNPNSATSRERYDATVKRVVPSVVRYMVLACGSFKSCGRISEMAAVIMTAEGVPTLVASRPGHFYNVIPLRDGGAVALDLTHLQFALPYGSPRDTDDPDEQAQIRAAMHQAMIDPMSVIHETVLTAEQASRLHTRAPEPAPATPATLAELERAVQRLQRAELRGNPAPYRVTIDPDELERVRAYPSDYERAIAHTLAAAKESVAAGDGFGAKAWISDVAKRLGIPMSRFAPLIALWHAAGLISLSRLDLVAAADPAKARESQVEVFDAGSSYANATYSFIVPSASHQRDAEALARRATKVAPRRRIP